MRACMILVAVCIFYTGIAQNNLYAAQANKFLNALNATQRKKALYDFNNAERYSWHFVPMNDRKGVPVNELDASQRKNGFDLLKMYLSDKAFKQTQEIMQLETVLKEIEQRQADDHYRDPGNYYFIFFNLPADSTAWGWRFEGHHISFSFSTINNRMISGTPGFLGSNPAVLLSGAEKGKEILKDEAALGFELIQSLSAQQQGIAIMSKDVPGDIFTSNSRTVLIRDEHGILYGDLEKKQQQIFLQLLSVYINRYSKKFADDMMQEIENADLRKLRFAWIGSPDHIPGQPYYYRIIGPTIIIELDNTQNSANHIHTVVRDLNNDFGGDELLQHYEKYHALTN